LNTKKCLKCGEIKDINLFPKDKNRKDGRYVVCNDCRSKPVEVTVILEEKQCKGCNEVKLINNFYNSKFSKDGHMGICKKCRDKEVPVTKIITEKVCTKCNILKPVSEFYKNKQRYDGYHSECKLCNSKQKKEYNKKVVKQNTEFHVDEIETTKQVKVCISCEIEKPIKLFNKRKYSLDGHASICRDCHSKEHQEEYYTHKDLSDEDYKEWRIKQNALRAAEKVSLKAEVFSHFCKDGIIKCANPYHVHDCMIVDDLDILTLDHINGDGYKEPRGTSGSRGGISFYRQIKIDGYIRDDLQVLCPSCQMKKRVIKHEYFNGKRSYLKYQNDVGVKA
jgi:hypothetical protein